jgi:hypothetical protein
MRKKAYQVHTVDEDKLKIRGAIEERHEHLVWVGTCTCKREFHVLEENVVAFLYLLSTRPVDTSRFRLLPFFNLTSLGGSFRSCLSAYSTGRFWANVTKCSTFHLLNVEYALSRSMWHITIVMRWRLAVGRA